MIKFEFGEAPKKNDITFHDVEINQFFINKDKRLCQKYSYYSYNIITKPDGTPWSERVADAKQDEIIKKILPYIVKIEVGDD